MRAKRVPSDLSTVRHLQRRKFSSQIDNASLRLALIVVIGAFAVTLWWSMRTLQGRISFTWFTNFQHQAQTVVDPIARGQLLTRPTAIPTVPPTAVPARPAQAAPAKAPIAPAPTPVLPYVTPNINVAGAVALVDSQIETPTPEPTATATATATETATPEPTPAATAVTKTPKPDKSVAPTATVPAGTKVYTVQPGDTVSSIARSLGISPSVIIALNHLTPPYKLVAGKDILIPAT